MWNSVWTYLLTAPNCSSCDVSQDASLIAEGHCIVLRQLGSVLMTACRERLQNQQEQPYGMQIGALPSAFLGTLGALEARYGLLHTICFP